MSSFPNSPEPDFNELLRRWAYGDKSVENAVFDLIYSELKRLMVAYGMGGRADFEWRVSALLREAQTRLTGNAEMHQDGRLSFFIIAAKVMRRIFVEQGWVSTPDTLDGAGVRVATEDKILALADHCSLLSAVGVALRHLEVLSPRRALIVELRFCLGLSEDEIAGILDISPRTVRREWNSARVWIMAELER